MTRLSLQDELSGNVLTFHYTPYARGKATSGGSGVKTWHISFDERQASRSLKRSVVGSSYPRTLNDRIYVNDGPSVTSDLDSRHTRRKIGSRDGISDVKNSQMTFKCVKMTALT